MKRIICLLAVLALLVTAVDSAEPEGGPVVLEMAALPLSAVILYTSGVGYFQRDGQVEGNARLDLRFKTDDINDLLKSLVVQDFDGGQVATVTYDCATRSPRRSRASAST